MRNVINKIGLPLLAAVVAPLLLALPVQAQVVNGNFETGDFTGWNTNISATGYADVVNNYSNFSNPQSYNPVDGNFFAILDSGTGVNSTFITQTLNVVAGQTLTGYAFFDTGDYLPNGNDDASVSLSNGATLFSSDVQSVGDYGSTPWTPFSYTFTTNGAYTLAGEVDHVTNNFSNSELGLDDISLSAAPEVSSVASFGILLAAMAALCVARRNRKSAS